MTSPPAPPGLLVLVAPPGYSPDPPAPQPGDVLLETKVMSGLEHLERPSASFTDIYNIPFVNDLLGGGGKQTEAGDDADGKKNGP